MYNTENFHQCIPYTFILNVTCPDFIKKDKQNFQLTIVNIFLPIIFNIYVLGAQKNRLIETILLSTHNICVIAAIFR